MRKWIIAHLGESRKLGDSMNSNNDFQKLTSQQQIEAIEALERLVEALTGQKPVRPDPRLAQLPNGAQRAQVANQN